MDKYYKAAEAIKKLGIPRSSFFMLADKGMIPRVVLPLRKQALYPKEEIDQIAAEQTRLLSAIEQEPERLELMTPTKEDLDQIVAIDQMIFSEETWMTQQELEARFAYNPEITHVLKDKQSDIVLGYISMSPMKQEILSRLINLEIDETLLKPEHYLPYVPGTIQDCYIISIAARPGPGNAQQYYGGRLINACKSYLLELLEHEIYIHHIYTVATTREGDRIARSLQFTPLVSENKWKNNYESFRRPYALDLKDKESKSDFTRTYQNHKKNLQRRKRRYIKEGRQLR